MATHRIVTHEHNPAQLPVLSFNTSPPSHENGKRVIVANGATGDFAGHVNKIAYSKDSAWYFDAPENGWIVFTKGDGLNGILADSVIYYDGTGWFPFDKWKTIVQTARKHMFEHPYWLYETGLGDKPIINTNLTKLSLLSAGMTGEYGSFYGFYNMGVYWANTSTGTNTARTYEVYSGSDIVYSGTQWKSAGASVRCVRALITGESVLRDGTTVPNAYEDNSGNLYDGVKIGNQVWMKTNLRDTKFADGTTIPYNFTYSTWELSTNPQYRIYPYNAVAPAEEQVFTPHPQNVFSNDEMAALYGFLYNWRAVSNTANDGLANDGGDGWKIPIQTDWEALLSYCENTLGYNIETVGVILKSDRVYSDYSDVQKELFPVGGNKISHAIFIDRDLDHHPQYLNAIRGDLLYEKVLGNPSINGYVLSSTTTGVRSWVEMTGGGNSSIPYYETFVAGLSQTEYILAHIPIVAWVWLNGLLQDLDAWSIVDDSIILSSAPDEGDSVNIYYLTAASIVNIQETDPIFTAHAAFNVTNTKISNWDAAYGWGNHAGLYELAITKSTGYAKWNGSSWTFANETYSPSTHDHTGVYQPANSNLTSVAGLTYVSAAFVKMTGTNTFTLDTSTYLTALPNHTLVGSHHTVSALTTGHFLKATGATTYGFGVHGLTYTDVGAQQVNNNLTSVAGLTYVSAAFVKMTGTNTFTLDTSTYLTALPNHTLVGSHHTVSALTTGHFLKATGATTYGFGAHGLTYTDVGAQQVNNNLTSVAGLTYVSAAFVKMTGTNTFTLDTSTYLTSVTSHNLLSSTHGDTATGTVARGDIIIGNATPAWARLAFPASPNGKVLQATTTDVAWSTNPITIGTSASVSGSNTGDVSLATNHGLSLSGQQIGMGTPSSITTSSTNSVTTTTHTHAITAGIGFIGNGSAQFQVPVTGGSPFSPAWTTSTNIFGTNGLNSLSYSALAFVKMSGTNTFSLDTKVYLSLDVTSTASASTHTINSGTTNTYIVTAQGAATTFAQPSGSPLQGQKLLIRLKDNGTQRAITWNGVFRAIGVALPATTTVSKTMYFGFIYNSTDTRWDLIAYTIEA